MNHDTHQERRWALIAGAAEGLGAGFCRVLARQGWNLAMVDFNGEVLHQEVAHLEKTYGITTRELVLDLAGEEASEICLEFIRNLDCRLLVYVAAYSKVSGFLQLMPGDLDRHLTVNNRTLLHLVHGFSHRLTRQNQTGNILLVASLAGLLGPKYVAVYAATKSFIIVLGEALHHELKPLGITVSVCIAGTIDTPQFRRSAPRLSRMSASAMQPEEVASCAIQNMNKRYLCIPGWMNRVQYFILDRLLPRRTATALVNREIEKMYQINTPKT